jgi:uncharacterized protein (TIGR00299 family) protein
MRTLYFDCFSGISGDMSLGALMDLGVDESWLVKQLRNLGLSGWELHVRSVNKNGLKALKVDVHLDDDAVHPPHPAHHVHRHEHTTMEAITTLLATAGIPEPAKDLALRIFRRLAEAEAKVHQTPVHEVHFHEVGALDSIIDIVGVSLCLHKLAPQKIFASVQHDGQGFVRCQHGLIPVPVPAVTELFATRKVPFRQHPLAEGELTTPTGAAIIAEVAESFGTMPSMQLVGVGYGAGDREYALPNILRVVLGETVDSEGDTAGEEHLTLLETNIDNTTPEVLGYVMERLLSAGAKDVFFVPVYMKKGRPATLLSVLCEEYAVAAMERIIFTETSTIGIRRHQVQRHALPREQLLVNSPYGPLKAKEVTFEGQQRAAVEYEDARRVAIETGTPLRQILSFVPGETLHIETT